MNRVQEIRKEKGLLQVEAATRAGITPQYWSQIERGISPYPPVNTAIRVADALEVDVTSIFPVQQKSA